MKIPVRLARASVHRAFTSFRHSDSISSLASTTTTTRLRQHTIRNPWDQLPAEIIIHIASFLLPFADLMLMVEPSYRPSTLPIPFRDWSCLSRTCIYLHDVLHQEMYHQAARIHDMFFFAVVWSGSQGAVDRFLSAGIKTQRKGWAYHSVLYRAVSARNFPMVQKLVGLYQLDEDADEDRRPSLSIAAYLMGGNHLYCFPITVAAQQGDLDVVSMLVDVAPPPSEALYQVYGARYFGAITKEAYLIRALHCACHTSQIPVIRFLIEKGADVNGIAPDDSYRHYTALHIACMRGHLAVVRLLLQSGAYVDARDSISRRPLHFATHSLPIVQTLIDAGADLQAESVLGTAIRSALRIGSPVETVRFLLERGMDPNSSWRSNTLLHEALIPPEHHSLEYFDVLFQFGSNTFLVRDEEGSTPIELAMRRYMRKSVVILLEGMKRWNCGEEHRLEVQQLQKQAEEWLREKVRGECQMALRNQR